MENSAYFKRFSSYRSKWRWGSLLLQWKKSVILGAFVWRVYIIFSHRTVLAVSPPRACVRAWGRTLGGRCAGAGAGGRQRRCSLSVSPARRRGALRHAAPRLLSTSSTASIVLLSCRTVSWVCVYSVVPWLSQSCCCCCSRVEEVRLCILPLPPTPSPRPHRCYHVIDKALCPPPRSPRCSNVLTELHGNSVSPQ